MASRAARSDHSCQPVFRPAGRRQPNDRQVRALGTREQDRKLPPALPVGLEQPVVEGLFRPELEVGPEVLPIAVPQNLARDGAPECPAGQPREQEGKRVVEPDHGVRERPDDIAHLAIISRHHPVVARRSFNDASAKVRDRGRPPPRLPVERVELDEVQA